MSRTGTSSTASPLAIAEVADERDREEIRLALALNGGVSLAVWIGGVSMEVNRLVRAANPAFPEHAGVWGELLELTQSKARVDVMAGASAGGINGALLAMALVHGHDLSALRKVWLDDGSLSALFRSPFQKDAPSLLQGDEYFLERLRRVFLGMTSSKVDPKIGPPIELIMTTTLLTGERKDFDDDFGQSVHDVTHRGQFRFRRDERDNHFLSREDAERLALASRSTASFPGAFEASFVPVRDADRGKRPDMSEVASFSSSRFVVDGGVLMNKPLGPVLRAVFDLPAEDRVRRVLAYVVPDPGVPTRADPDDPTDIPSMAKVVASAITLPRQESILEELEEVRAHNRKVEDLHHTRRILLMRAASGELKLTQQAGWLFEAYAQSRAGNQTAFFLEQLTVGARYLDAREGAPPDPFHRAALRDVMVAKVRRHIGQAFPGRGTDLDAWLWDVKTVESTAGLAIDVLRQALGLTLPGKKPPWPKLREELRKLRNRIGDLLKDLREIRGDDIGFWRDHERARAYAEAADEQLESLVDADLAAWSAGQQKLSGVSRELAQILADAQPTLRSVHDACDPIDRVHAPRFQDLLRGLQLWRSRPSTTALLRRLLALAVIQQGLTAGQAPIDQRVSLIQVSADAPNGFDHRAMGEDKLAGIQLGHFGAFYKRAWRANDWMWGRLDGAYRLVQVVLHPPRIRKLAQTLEKDGDELIEHVLDRIERVALGPEGSQDRAPLAERWERAKAREDLQFLKDRSAVTAPKTLSYCAEAVARRIQMEIIAEELPQVAAAIEHDRDDGAITPPRVRDFADGVRKAVGADSNGDAAVRLPPKAAVRLFEDCEVGKERILGDAGSDLFTNTVSTAAATSISAVYGKRSGLGPLRGVLGSLRGFALALFVLARSATGKTRTLFAALLLLLATGGAMLAFGITNQDPNSTLIWVGLAVVLAGLLLATIRAGPWWVLALVAATSALALGAYSWLRSVDPGQGQWQRAVHDLAPAASVVAVILGSVVLGLLSERASGWLPRNSRVVAAMIAAVGTVVIVIVAVIRDWSRGVLGAAVLLLGLLVGWIIREDPRGWSVDFREAFNRWRHDPRLGHIRERVRAAAVGVLVSLAAAAVFLLLVALASRPVVVAVAAIAGLAGGWTLRHLWRRREPARRIKIEPLGGGRDGYRVTWSPRPARAGMVYDVFVKGPADRAYRPWLKDELAGSDEYRPQKGPGTYVFRVRYRTAGTGRHWGWWPLEKLEVPAPDTEDGRSASAEPSGRTASRR